MSLKFHYKGFIGVAPAAVRDPSFSPLAPADPRTLVEVRYRYDGSKGPAYVGIRGVGSDGSIATYSGQPIKPGANQVETFSFSEPWNSDQIRPASVEVFIHTKEGAPSQDRILATKKVESVITLPKDQWARSETDPKSLLGGAIAMIDVYEGSYKLDLAKSYLDKVLADDPSNVQAYLELARIAMKSDDDRNERQAYAGVTEAQRLIKVALKIDPDYANSYILLGYVLAVQHKYDGAVEAFKKAQQIGTQNLWLYYNWGLALENAGRNEEAIKKYQQGVALTPMPYTPETVSSNRAIPMLFMRLTNLLEKKNDVAALSAMYDKSLIVLHNACQKTDYARFKLEKMADFDAAILWGTRALEQSCHANVRSVLAVAYLSKWALGKSPMPPKDRERLFMRAQTFITDTQQTIVDIASNPVTAKALPQLKGAGFDLDAKDTKGMTPLAYAAAKGTAVGVQELIHAGANPDVVLAQGWTPLMIAVASNNADVVRVLLNSHVNVERKSVDGQTALSLARSMGNGAMLKMLGVRAKL